MNISNDPVPLSTASLPAESFANISHAQAGTLAPAFDPDNPPWGIFAAVLAWIASIVLLLFVQLIFILPYGIFKYRDAGLAAFAQALQTDPTAILLQIVSVIPTHLLTLVVVWAIVTQSGKRPFWQTLGWSWSENFGFWSSVGVAALMLGSGILINKLFGGGKTQIDQIVASSIPARITVAVLATATAPLVEELIYRGVLYSALFKGLTRLNEHRGVANARRTAMISTVFAVSFLFALVHVFQYINNVGVIIAVALLSLVLTLTRALTGRLLPCFIIHLIFNGIQSLTILFEPLFPHQDAGNTTSSIVLNHFIYLIQNLL